MIPDFDQSAMFEDADFRTALEIWDAKKDYGEMAASYERAMW